MHGGRWVVAEEVGWVWSSGLVLKLRVRMGDLEEESGLVCGGEQGSVGEGLGGDRTFYARRRSDIFRWSGKDPAQAPSANTGPKRQWPRRHVTSCQPGFGISGANAIIMGIKNKCIMRRWDRAAMARRKRASCKNTIGGRR